MKMALDQLAEYTEDPSMSERDPLSPLSFSCVTEEVRAYLLTGDGDGERGTPNRILSKNRRRRVHKLYG